MKFLGRYGGWGGRVLVVEVDSNEVKCGSVWIGKGCILLIIVFDIYVFLYLLKIVYFFGDLDEFLMKNNIKLFKCGV